MIVRAAIAFFTMTVLLMGPARAAHATGCQSEVDRFCQGEKEVLKCLRSHQIDLSPGCTTYLGMFEKIPSCLSDAAKLCPNTRPTVSTVVGCLRSKQDSLSDECKAELAKIRKTRKSH
jgi:hypothetical protein